MLFLSFVMPVWKSELYINKTLGYLKAQSNKNFELVICNSDSPDRSMEIINKFISDEADFPVVIVNIEKNDGPALARNRGIDAASGEYIFFYDSDDLIEAYFVEKMYKNTDTLQNHAVFCGHKFIDENDNLIKDFSIKNDYMKNKWHFSQTWQIMLKTQLIKHSGVRFPEGNIYPEDFPFFINLMPLIKNWGTVEEGIYGYRIHNISLCNSGSKLPCPSEAVFNTVMGYFERAYTLCRTEDERVCCEYRAIKAYYWIMLMWFPTIDYNEINKKYTAYQKIMMFIFPDYLSNKMIGLFKPQYEVFSTRFRIWICKLLERISLLPISIKIYKFLKK